MLQIVLMAAAVESVHGLHQSTPASDEPVREDTISRKWPGVTAVISTHNRRDELCSTLNHLRGIRYPALSVIVIDNSSTDDTRALLRRDFPEIRLFPHSDNLPLRGYNIGFAMVTTPYLLVLDDDSTPRAGTLEAMIEQLESVPGAGAAAANIVGPDGASEWEGATRVKSSSGWYNLIGCGFLARTHVIRRAGGYNEQFELYYNDLDLALRILAMGCAILYNDDWIVDHRRTPVSRISTRKLCFMIRNFPSLIRCHISGWRRWDLIAGHTALCLYQALEEGCLTQASLWLRKGLGMPGQREFMPLPDSPATAGFVAEYSLLRLLRKRLSGESASLPAVLPEATPVPAANLGTMVLGAAQRSVSWRSWRRRGGCNKPAGERTRRAAALRRGKPAVQACESAATLGWYRSPWKDYQRYLKTTCPTCAERRNQRATIWDYQPVISILTAVHQVSLDFLDECLRSVECQTNEGWELCLVEDGSGSRDIRARLEAFAARHGERVRLILRDENRGIAHSLQEAFENSTGDYVAVLDHDDRLAPEAVHEVVAFLNLRPETDWVYSDNDKISPDGERFFYHFKPDWSPDLLLSYNYVHHFSVMRRELVAEAGGFQAEFNGAQDYDLYLRLAERTRRIGHIERVLYSWRQAASSVAVSMTAKPYVADAGLRSLKDALLRRRDAGEAMHDTRSWEGNYRVYRNPGRASVDLVILGAECRQGEAFQAWDGQSGGVFLKARFAAGAGEVPGRTLARALSESTSRYVLITEGLARPGSEDTLAWLVSCLGCQGLGAVAPAIVGESGSFDHCGLALAPGGRVLYPLRGLSAEKAHFGAYGALVRNVSAVSPVAVLFCVETLRQSGGFDPSLGAAGAVIDACLGLRLAGRRVAVDGGVRGIFGPGRYDVGPAMRCGGSDLQSLVLKRPRLTVAGDPYYNRNLCEDPAEYGIRVERERDHD